MDIFFLQLVVLFAPGFIWERIDFIAGVNRPSTQFDVIRRAFCFGVFTYVVLFSIVLLLNILIWPLAQKFPVIDARIPAFKKDEYFINGRLMWEAAVACLLAFPLAAGWLKLTNNRIPILILRYLGLTNRYGDEDVWDFTFNRREANVEYVHVRDLDNELNWSGWVELFSETGQNRELTLRDVEVTNLAGELQYTSPRVYLSRPTDSITIEFPYKLAIEPEEKR